MFSDLVQTMPGMSSKFELVRYLPQERTIDGYSDTKTERDRHDIWGITQPFKPEYRYRVEMRGVEGIDIKDCRLFYLSRADIDKYFLTLTTQSDERKRIIPAFTLIWSKQFYDMFSENEWQEQGFKEFIGIRRNQNSVVPEVLF